MESKYVLLLAFISIILAFICSSVGLCLSASQHFKSINGYKKQNSNLSDKRYHSSLVQSYIQVQCQFWA